VSSTPDENSFEGVTLSRRRGLLGVAMALLSVPLAACGGGSPLETFDLSATTFSSGAARGRGQLVIAEPVATSPANSDRIVVRPTPESIATLKGAQWTESLPHLMQTRLVQSFENSRGVRAVGRPGSGIDADYTLVSEIRRFEIDVAAQEAVVELSVKLVSERGGRVVAAGLFNARAPGSASDGAAAAAGLDAALAKAMHDIIVWTSTRI
jgi:cholesterol transport system auxiliary component